MAFAAFGAKLKIGDGGDPESFTTVAEVKSIDFSLENAQEEVTNHGSAGGWAEFVSTILSGTVDMTINYLPDDSTHDATDGLLNDLESQTQGRNFQLQHPDDTTTRHDFAANVQSFESSDEVDGVLEADLTLQITGQPTLDAA